MDTEIEIKKNKNINTFNDVFKYLLKYILMDNSKLKPLMNFYKNYYSYQKLPVIYTNPKYNPITQKLEFGSFEYELEQAKKRQRTKYYNPITDFYWNLFNKNNKFNNRFIKTFRLCNPKFNTKTKKLEFSYTFNYF